MKYFGLFITVSAAVSLATFLTVVPVMERQAKEVSQHNREITEKALELRELRKELALEKERHRQMVSLKLRVTAYTPTKEECDSTPKVTALNRKSRPGYSAAAGTDCRHLLGKKVYVSGLGVYHVTDVKPGKGLDLMVGTKKEAKKIGASIKQVNVIGG